MKNDKTKKQQKHKNAPPSWDDDGLARALDDVDRWGPGPRGERLALGGGRKRLSSFSSAAYHRRRRRRRRQAAPRSDPRVHPREPVRRLPPSDAREPREDGLAGRAGREQGPALAPALFCFYQDGEDFFSFLSVFFLVCPPKTTKNLPLTERSEFHADVPSGST